MKIWIEKIHVARWRVHYAPGKYIDMHTEAAAERAKCLLSDDVVQTPDELQPPPMVHYTVNISGDWYGDEMPEAEWDEDRAVERTVARALAGGTYTAHLVCATWPDGTFVSYSDEEAA